MKTILKLTLGLLFIYCSASAQIINIHTNNGTDSYNLTDIDSITFSVPGGTNPGTVTDIDGNVYNTVTIGNQIWMKENLKVIHYRNGDPIPSNLEGWPISSGAYCNYNNDTTNTAVYGRLYNWYAVTDSRKIAPAGWHVATDDDWKQLEMYLGMSQAGADSIGWRGTNQGGKLKETGLMHWNSPNTGATNETGFTALPGGWCTNYSGQFGAMGEQCFFWMPDTVDNGNGLHRRVVWVNAGVYRFGDNKQAGFSIRCIKD